MIIVDTSVISELVRGEPHPVGGFAGCGLTVIDPWMASGVAMR